MNCVRQLVASGAAVNAIASWGIVPLACGLESLQTLQFLLSRGALVNFPEHVSLHLNDIYSSLKVNDAFP